MENKKFVSLSYNNGKPFLVRELENFLEWCVFNGVSDITIQNEDKIVCEIDNKKHHVTPNRLNLADVASIATYMHSPGIISILNGGEEVDFAWSYKKNRDVTYRFRVNAKSIQLMNEEATR